ncbi:MAG: TolC family protein [Phycisphaeraceae bacterium]|nr:TolC family protein [Phycisphaeraceae bacterium]
MSAVLLAAGCGGGMAKIDRQLAKVVQDRSRAMAASAPGVRPPGDYTPDRGRTSKTPATTNPESGELSYVPGVPADSADEELRRVNDRLRRFHEQAAGGGAGEYIPLTLDRAFEVAQLEGREYRDAEEDYLIAAIRLLIERHRWGPRLFNDSNVSLSGEGDDGRFDNAVRVVNTLRANQRLPYGGQAEARWVWRATQDLRSSVSGQYRQSSEIVFDANMPLMRGAGLVAQESLIQSERELVYAARDFEHFRRSHFVSVADDYFRLLQAAARINNQVSQLQSLRLFEEQQRAKFDAGRISQFDLNNATNRVLQAVSTLASLREQFTLQLDRYKVRLGIPVETSVRLSGVSFGLTAPVVDLDEATRAALAFRLDLQNRRDRLLDAQRNVDVARNNLLPDLGVGAQVGIPTDPDAREGGVAFDPDETRYEASMTLSLPLDRQIERLQLRQSLLNRDRQQRSYERFSDDIVVDVRRRVREIDLARFRLELAERQVQINERRLEEQRIRADLVDTRTQLDALTDLLNSQNDRDQALTDLRIAVLNYLLASGQLRVRLDGTLEALPGMDVRIEHIPLDYARLLGEDDEKLPVIIPPDEIEAPEEEPEAP